MPAAADEMKPCNLMKAMQQKTREVFLSEGGNECVLGAVTTRDLSEKFSS